MMKNFAIKGNILWSTVPERMEMRAGAWVVCEAGRCSGVFDTLPERLSGIERTDFGDRLVIPGFYDLHLHAAQYDNCGLGMDFELLDWLEKLAYPTEAAFRELEYAEAAYTRFVRALRRSSTVRACVFATVHTPATLLLMQKLEASGLVTMVGRVNMDRAAPDSLREANAQASLRDTELWLAECGHFCRTRPILTPRFVPSCSDELLAGLGKTANDSALPIQSHLSENLDEIALVASLHPDCRNYASVYEKYGLLGKNTVMAHCVHLSDEEISLLRQRKVYMAHCPTSNTNIRSGIAPVRRYLDEGLRIGLATDVSGGHTLDMAEVVRHAVEVSKLLWRVGDGGAPLSTTEAFYLATRGGGSFFGDAGAFEPGFEFDAVIIDDTEAATGVCRRSLAQRFEQMFYRPDHRRVCAKFTAGERLF